MGACQLLVSWAERGNEGLCHPASSHAFAYLVRITADCSHTLDPEVERFDRIACLLEEGDDKATKAAVNVQAEVVSLCELAKSDDVIFVSVWEVYARSDQLSKISRRLSL